MLPARADAKIASSKRDVVDHLLAGDRIGLGRRGRRGRRQRDCPSPARPAAPRPSLIGPPGHRGGDDPAVRRLDMRLVANVDPALRAEDREARDEGIGERGGDIGRAAAAELDDRPRPCRPAAGRTKGSRRCTARFRPDRAAAPTGRADECRWPSCRRPAPDRPSDASCRDRATETCRG